MLHALLDSAGGSFVDGAYDKVILKLSEPDFPLKLLPPYETTTGAVYQSYRANLAADYPGWLPARGH